MAGRISRISPHLIAVIADVKKKHGIKNLAFTEATGYLALAVEKDPWSFLRQVPDSRKKEESKYRIPKKARIQWY